MINITKFYILNIFSFSGPNRIVSLIKFRTKKDLMIFDMVIYVTLINFTEMEFILYLAVTSMHIENK